MGAKRMIALWQQQALRALTICREKRYETSGGDVVSLEGEIDRAMRGKVSLSPEVALCGIPESTQDQTHIAVTQETTLEAACRLFADGEMPLALNFANGLQPGGGFLLGANAQEESLCRCSALYMTLLGDPMYRAHQAQGNYGASDWAILSPEVPVFAKDDGSLEDTPWPLGFLTCAAPVATPETQDHASELMESRIDRVLHIAVHYGYGSLVLGAWGCGAFKNDPFRIADIFQRSLRGRFKGQFDEVVFAIADPNPESRRLQAFREIFQPQ